MQVSTLVDGILFKWTISDQKKKKNPKNPERNYKDMQNEHEKKQDGNREMQNNNEMTQKSYRIHYKRRSGGVFAPLAGLLHQLVHARRGDHAALNVTGKKSFSFWGTEAAHFNRQAEINI